MPWRRCPPARAGSCFCPTCWAERTALVNPNARDAFLGLNLATRREDMLRAVLEGIAMNLGIIVNIFRGHLPIAAMTVIGGGARSQVWRQIMGTCMTAR